MPPTSPASRPRWSSSRPGSRSGSTGTGSRTASRPARALVAAVVLAAGAGRRFAGPAPKLAAEWRGRSLLAWALDAPLAAGLDTAIVTGATSVADLLDDLPAGVSFVPNPDWAAGQATSVAAGIRWAAGRGHDAVVVGLGDQPLVTAAAWRALADADGDLVVATYGGRRGNPVRLGAAVWPLLPAAGDAVGRSVMATHPELVQELACDGDPVDVDTAADLRRLRGVSPSPEEPEERNEVNEWS